MAVEARIERGRQRIAGGASVAEASRAAGYRSASAFRRAFRAVRGYQPDDADGAAPTPHGAAV